MQRCAIIIVLYNNFSFVMVHCLICNKDFASGNSLRSHRSRYDRKSFAIWSYFSNLSIDFQQFYCQLDCQFNCAASISHCAGTFRPSSHLFSRYGVGAYHGMSAGGVREESLIFPDPEPAYSDHQIVLFSVL